MMVRRSGCTLQHHIRQDRCELFISFGVQMNLVRRRHARLRQYRAVQSHRIDEPDAPRPYFIPHRLNICMGVGGT